MVHPETMVIRERGLILLSRHGQINPPMSQRRMTSNLSDTIEDSNCTLLSQEMSQFLISKEIGGLLRESLQKYSLLVVTVSEVFRRKIHTPTTI